MSKNPKSKGRATSKRPVSKKRKPFVTNPHRPQLGTHIDKHIHLNPRHPRPHEPGEKRGTGKPPIRIEVLNTIRYKLRNEWAAKIFTHHVTSPKTLMRDSAQVYIREWLGLEPGDWLEVLEVQHTFTHDIPAMKVEADPTQRFCD